MMNWNELTDKEIQEILENHPEWTEELIQW